MTSFPQPLRRVAPERLPRHLDRLYRAAWAMCGSPHDAEALVQETYLRVLARPRLLRRDDELPYLMRVLRNAYLTSLRTASRRPRTAELPEDRSGLLRVRPPALPARGRSATPTRIAGERQRAIRRTRRVTVAWGRGLAGEATDREALESLDGGEMSGGVDDRAIAALTVGAGPSLACSRGHHGCGAGFLTS
jgi:DNA-directed RNA polymerase specialized sigma24 family protein